MPRTPAEWDSRATMETFKYRGAGAPPFADWPNASDLERTLEIGTCDEGGCATRRKCGWQ